MLILYTTILLPLAALALPSEGNDRNVSQDLLDSIQQEPIGPAYRGQRNLCRATNAFRHEAEESQCPYPASIPTAFSSLDEKHISRGEAKNVKECAKTCLFAGFDTCKAIAFDPEDHRCIHFSVRLEDLSSQLGEEKFEGVVIYEELLGDETYSAETLWPVECWGLDCSGLFVGDQLKLREKEEDERIRAYWTPERMAAAEGL